MSFITPFWVLPAILLAYLILLVVLTCKLIINVARYGTLQMLVMLLVLWSIPVAGPIIVLVVSRRISKVPSHS